MAEIELDLSLSLGRSFRMSGRPTVMAEESGLSLREIRRSDSLMSDAENESSVTDRFQSSGKQESKRKLTENRKTREIGGGEGLDSGTDAEGKHEERRKKKEKKEKKEAIVDLSLSNQSFLPCKLLSISPMQYSCPPVQYLPVAHMNGFAFPCVMPWWDSGSGAGNFKPYQVNQIVDQSGECKFNNGDTEKSSDGSRTCSSSVVADNRSCSNEGSGSRSRSSKSLRDLESNSSTGNDDFINHLVNPPSTRPPDDHNAAESFDKEAGRKALDSKSRVKNDKFLQPRTHIDESPSLSSMPCVSAVGDGPDRKRITGFLYRYTESEVSIVCVCHGKSFSPAEFVRHAGGKAESNPLRQITVIPSAFA